MTIENFSYEGNIFFLHKENFKINGEPVFEWWECRRWTDETETCTFTECYFSVRATAKRSNVIKRYNEYMSEDLCDWDEVDDDDWYSVSCG